MRPTREKALRLRVLQGLLHEKEHCFSG
jgi:hypothetical protein